MKLTKKTVKSEVETTETVCEIAQDEFEKLCAECAAKTVADFIGVEPDADDLMAGIQLTHLFAKFGARLVCELFEDTNENPDKKEEN